MSWVGFWVLTALAVALLVTSSCDDPDDTMGWYEDGTDTFETYTPEPKRAIAVEDTFSGITVEIDEWGNGTIETRLTGQGSYWFQEAGFIDITTTVWENGEAIHVAHGRIDVQVGATDGGSGEKEPDIKVP